METFLGLTSTGWTAATAFATIGLVFYAARTLKSSARDSANRSRPVLIPKLETDKWGDRVLLTITNFGSTAAFNLNVQLSESYETHDFSTASQTGRYRELLLKKFKKPIPAFAPGEKDSSNLMFALEHGEGNPNPLMGISLTLSYDGSDFKPRKKDSARHQYHQEFDLTLHHRINEFRSSSSRDLDKQMDKVIRHLANIASNGGRQAEAVEELSETLPDRLRHSIDAGPVQSVER